MASSKPTQRTRGARNAKGRVGLDDPHRGAVKAPVPGNHYRSGSGAPAAPRRPKPPRQPESSSLPRLSDFPGASRRRAGSTPHHRSPRPLTPSQLAQSPSPTRSALVAALQTPAASPAQVRIDTALGQFADCGQFADQYHCHRYHSPLWVTLSLSLKVRTILQHNAPPRCGPKSLSGRFRGFA